MNICKLKNGVEAAHYDFGDATISSNSPVYMKSKRKL